MRSRLFLILFSVLNFAPLAFAHETVIGDGATRVSEWSYPYLCKLTMTAYPDDEDDGIISTCSGTLIAPDFIVTAAHCFESDYQQIQVQCGGQDVGSVDSVAHQNRNDWALPRQPRPSIDVATVKLSRRQNLQTLPFALSPDDFFSNDSSGTIPTLKPGITCKVAGFGVNPTGRYGYLYTAEMSALTITFAGGVVQAAPQQGYLPTSVDHGDSGGALICSGNGVPDTLVGITGGFSFDHNMAQKTFDYFAAPWSNLNYLSPDTSPVLSSSL